MSGGRMIFDVAWWEFRRFFKFRDVLITVLLFVLGTLAYSGIKLLIERSQAATARVVVLNAGALRFELPEESLVEIVPAEGRSEAEWRDAVGRREIDGLLILRGQDDAELLVAKEPFWQGELVETLSAARREARIRSARLDPRTLADVLAPFEIDVSYHESAAARLGRSEKAFAAVVVSLMLLGVIAGNAHLFAGITGEKQQRVTEQVVAAISPQTWIDGKILGLSLMAFVSILNTVVGLLLTVAIRRTFGSDLSVPLGAIDPWLLSQLVFLALLGFFFWFAFFAAIAATIDDPNTSARSTFLLLPVLPLAVAFAVLKTPDTWLMKFFGMFPLTSPAVMPARLVLTRVAAWEVLVAVVALVASIWLARRAAGKIFALGILMYGKEPSWSEMWRSLKQA